MQRVHLSTARQMLATPDPVDLVVWKQDGSIVEYDNCVSLRSFKNGTRNIKLLQSGQIRRVRDVLIYKINGMEIFL